MGRIAQSLVSPCAVLVLLSACGEATPTDNGDTAPLTIRTQPSGAAAGQPFSVQPVIEVRDADNATVVTAAMDLGGGTLGGTLTATTVSGVATFTDLQITGGTGGDRALSFAASGLPSVISDVFSLSCGPSGIVSWWPGEGEGSEVWDVVGPNDGTLENGSTRAAGKVGQAFSLDAVDDFVGAPAVDVGDLQQLTVEVWVKLNAILPARVQRFVTLGNEKAVLRLSWENLEFYMRIDGQLVFLLGGSALQAGVFHHVVGTYDGSAMKLFVDGVEIGSRAVSGMVETTDFLHFSSSDEPLGGLLDEITVYDRALSAEEIQAEFAADSAGKCRI